MTSTPLAITPATPDDVPLVLEFIRGLAEYERLSHECVATEEGLHDAMFGPRPVVEVLIARVGDTPAGFALFFHNFSTFLGKRGIYLEDLFVRPEFRSQGIGRALLSALAALTLARGGGRLEWSVLNWNESAIRFYRSLGAVAMDAWTVNRVSGPALDALANNERPLSSSTERI